jgi:dienelactone hydrolase
MSGRTVSAGALILLGALLAGCAGTRGDQAAGAGSAPREPGAGSSGSAVLRTSLAVPAESREIPVRIGYPVRGKDLRVVLFSHGAFSSRDDYDPILDPWAAAGYVVIAPTHRDSTTLGGRRGAGDPRHFGWRLDDMERLLADLEVLLDRVPGLRARARLDRIAATGHSFGGLVAQTIAGGTYFDPASGRTVSRRDARIVAALVFSGAGPFPPSLRDTDFAAIRVPLLVSVGTNDLRQAPDLSGYEWRRRPFDLAPADGSKYLLVLDGADHYLGGRVGRDDLPRDPRSDEYLAAFRRVSLRFLAAYVRDDAAALRALRAATAAAAGVAALSAK